MNIFVDVYCDIIVINNSQDLLWDLFIFSYQKCSVSPGIFDDLTICLPCLYMAINTRWILYLRCDKRFLWRPSLLDTSRHSQLASRSTYLLYLKKKKLLSPRVPSSCFRLPAGDRFRCIISYTFRWAIPLYARKTENERLIIIVAPRAYNMFTFRIRLKCYLQLGRFYCNPMV